MAERACRTTPRSHMAREARARIAEAQPRGARAMGLPETRLGARGLGRPRLGRGRDGRVGGRSPLGTIARCASSRGRKNGSSCSPPRSSRADDRAAGLRLNHPEAVALICDAMLEAARAGAGYAEVEAAGRAAVDPAEVIDGVRELLDEVRLEVLLGDGARVIALVDPLGRGDAARPARPGRARRSATRRTSWSTRAARRSSSSRDEPVAAADPDLLALPVRPGRTRASSSIGPRRAGSTSTSPAGA